MSGEMGRKVGAKDRWGNSRFLERGKDIRTKRERGSKPRGNTRNSEGKG